MNFAGRSRLILLVDQMQQRRHRRAARAQAQDLPAGSAKIARFDDRVEAQPGGDRVFGVPAQLIAALGDRRDFAGRQRVGIDVVEHVAGSVVEVDLVGRDQRAERVRVAFDLGNRAAVVLRVVVDGVVDAFKDHFRTPDDVHPQRKHLIDRGFPGRDANEVTSWSVFLDDVVVGHESNSYLLIHEWLRLFAKEPHPPTPSPLCREGELSEATRRFAAQRGEVTPRDSVLPLPAAPRDSSLVRPSPSRWSRRQYAIPYAASG